MRRKQKTGVEKESLGGKVKQERKGKEKESK